MCAMLLAASSALRTSLSSAKGRPSRESPRPSPRPTPYKRTSGVQSRRSLEHTAYSDSPSAACALPSSCASSGAASALSSSSSDAARSSISSTSIS
eukprot:CAMPEP_0119385774 /NCGR_PEP_ID=MMETSP1334-20130426/92773_1 /TAXON_ID=127549 /ORGANISM="Calcidiscus leptoporus, Strain RCC1130" /LENGTH=95 /DNA_ID=CAMNT_0007407127 /DNA_START=537 /DNA_END=821 /DNA_ORIENTATION=+